MCGAVPGVDLPSSLWLGAAFYSALVNRLNSEAERIVTFVETSSEKEVGGMKH